MTYSDEVRAAVRAQLSREGLRPFAARTGLPIGRIRGLLDGRAVLSTTLDAAAEALKVTPARLEASSVEEHRPPWEELRAEITDLRQVVLKRLGPSPESGLGANASGREDLSRRPVETVELAAAAGGGAEVFDETPVGRIWFRRDWLDGLGLDATQCSVIGVEGDSMEPTLPDGCKILVNRASRRRLDGRIFVLRTGEGLVAKRLARTRSRWELQSDNPTHPTQPWAEDTEIIGEVRWSGRVH